MLSTVGRHPRPSRQQRSCVDLPSLLSVHASNFLGHLLAARTVRLGLILLYFLKHHHHHHHSLPLLPTAPFSFGILDSGILSRSVWEGPLEKMAWASCQHRRQLGTNSSKWLLGFCWSQPGARTLVTAKSWHGEISVGTDPSVEVREQQREITAQKGKSF